MEKERTKEDHFHMHKVSLVIRNLTIPPVFAAVLLLILYFTRPEICSTPWQLVGGLVFLCILPLSAYPLQRFVPHFKDKGREGQRSLAMIFSSAGYLAGVLFALLTDASDGLKLVFWEYLFCGIVILVFNKALRIRVSGHACGITGPVILLMYFGLYLPAVIGAAFIVFVYISSLQTKRHTAPQLVGGSLVPAAVLSALLLIM